MIKKDQPTLFGSAVTAAVSSVEDGNMKFGINSPEETIGNRRRFLERVGIDFDHTTLVTVTYDTDDFAKYRVATHSDKVAGMDGKGQSVYADALAVRQPNHALFLPLADCVGAVLYDAQLRVLMVSHLGRHSTEIEGANKSVRYMAETFGSAPADIRVWLSPAVGSATYPLHTFGGKSLHEVIVEQLTAAGVPADMIEVSRVDTAYDDNYFSHSQSLKDPAFPQGRFAIVAMMNAQGEPAA